MQRSLLLLLTVFTLLLTGCASPQSAAERPYTDAEVKQFALEMLSRSGLPYEDYEKIRSALQAPNYRVSNSIRDVDPAHGIDPEG
ncbi:hypothetical protein DNK06_02230 [Pseudomonas daroniae]|uniref:Lipoprotein n=1 Tax=Phytopseudomonas daroniae TaxID=2487519 RepID=A0A4Q9QQT6_9GAMM|nr:MULTISPECIES: hypothetical protein [Pseudomonas]TBU77201.1 hypothetical protein DNK10_06755 [Pseudomonas daroniae]TBU83282.1 hypothetical protein DNK06_02230 [Pseudomonas daroniae]TBU84921.1 hypothetical protein DNK31_04610 [Pseudomonas sp. FRB 228]TBU93786.1 hypothetical protein DNJ99_05460 [Pseudomonas daroniae]